MNYEEVPSRESISSENVSTQMHEAHGAGNSTNPSKFVNQGLLLWNRDRQKWIGEKKAVRRSKKLRFAKLRTLCLCITKSFCCGGSVTYDKLLRKNKQFPRPIPLREMVDFLVDIWEQEGLCDRENALKVEVKNNGPVA